MSNERFYPGQIIIRPRIQYAIKEGNRRPTGDLVLGFSLDGGRTYYVPPIEHMLICVSLKYQVEENNYPRSKGYEGGGKLLRAIESACLVGWESQSEKIAEEAKRAAENRNAYIQGQLSL